MDTSDIIAIVALVIALASAVFAGVSAGAARKSAEAAVAGEERARRKEESERVVFVAQRSKDTRYLTNNGTQTAYGVVLTAFRPSETRVHVHRDSPELGEVASGETVKRMFLEDGPRCTSFEITFHLEADQSDAPSKQWVSTEA